MTGFSMNGKRIKHFLTRRRSRKEWAVIAILAIAACVELLDAVLGVQAIAVENRIAPGSVLDVADVVVGVTAAFIVRVA